MYVAAGGLLFIFQIGAIMGFITRGGVVELGTGEKPVIIGVLQEGVYFNNKLEMIKDSSSLSYEFKTIGGRVLSIRWIGTQDETLLPIWEFTAVKDCGSIMRNTQFVGYKTFSYVKGRLEEISGAISQVA
jgi:hypothetical protein